MSKLIIFFLTLLNLFVLVFKIFTMKSFFSNSLILLSFLITQKSSSQSFSWAQGFTTTGGVPVSSASINASIFDSANSIYSIGNFTGTIDLDQGSNIYNVTSAQPGDLFLLKEDTAGNFIWAKSFHRKSNINFGINGRSISLDAENNIYIAGSFTDTIDFDPGPGTYYMGPPMGIAINFNGFVVKLDSSGNFVWAKQIGGLAGSTAGFTNLKINTSGDIILQGSIINNGTIDVDPGPNVVNFTGGGILIEKLNSTGNFIWAKKIDVGQGSAQSMVIDSLSNIYFTGMFMGTVDFDPGSGIYNLTHNGGFGDIFVTKLDSAGNFQWAKQIGNADGDWGQGISVDPFGNVFVVGYYQGPVDFDPGPGVFNITTWSRDMFVLRLRNNGDFSWVKSIHPAANDDARAVTTDGQGNVYTTGEFFSAADFDPGPGVHMLTGGVYVQKLDSTGNYVWAVDWEADIPGWIGLDHSNNVYTTGVFTGTNRDFDPGSGTFLLSGYSGSGFILKLTQQSIIDNIEEHEHFQQGVKVYPNPSTGSLTFSSSEKIDLITITDLQGKVVFTYSPNNIKTTVNLSQLSSGMYFYTLVHGQKRLNGNFIIETTR